MAYEEVTSLEVDRSELRLKAFVADASGQPAQKGTVVFEYCSYKGVPPNDLERADEAPAEACAGGSARWRRHGTASVTGGTCVNLGDGYACQFFGVVMNPRTVGFRITYSPQGSSIAEHTTEPENFTWSASS